MIKDYFVKIPPTLSDVLADLGDVSRDSDFDTIITAGRTSLFSFVYPISTADKQPLEEFILNYYIMRRIGSGNFKKWKQMLKAKMLEIMPYYKQLLDSEKLSFEPLLNNEITTTDNGSGTLDTTRDKRTDNDDAYNKSGTYAGNYTKSGTESNNSTELNRYSDTPQGDSSRVWEVDEQGHVSLSDYYITDVRGITDSGSRSYSESGQDANTTTESGTDSRDIVEHETIDTDTTSKNTNLRMGVANQSKSSLLNEYRETFLRIYGMIAEELEPLFYNLVEIDDIIDFV